MSDERKAGGRRPKAKVKFTIASGLRPSAFLWPLAFLVGLSLCSIPAVGQKPPPVERITDNVYRVGAITIDTKAGTVICPGEINMDSGSIEYLAVGPHGKLHESLLRLDVRPTHLQVSLLLLGLEPKNVLERQGDKKTPQGAPVELLLRWRDKTGKMREMPVETCIVEGQAGKPMPAGVWVFTGSRILKEGFEAELSHSLIAVWHDPAAILDNPRKGGADNGYLINSKRTPKRGTKIELVIKKVMSNER